MGIQFIDKIPTKGKQLLLDMLTALSNVLIISRLSNSKFLYCSGNTINNAKEPNIEYMAKGSLQFCEHN